MEILKRIFESRIGDIIRIAVNDARFVSNYDSTHPSANGETQWGMSPSLHYLTESKNVLAVHHTIVGTASLVLDEFLRWFKPWYGRYINTSSRLCRSLPRKHSFANTSVFVI